VIWPVQSSLKKDSASPPPQITSKTLAIPSHTEGRYANVTDVGTGCDGRSGARDGRCRCGRRSRVVLTPRRWCQVGGNADDGGKQARSHKSTKETVKTIARGCRAFSGVTVVTNARVYYHTTRGCGRVGRPASLRPLIGGQGNLIANLGRFARRGRTRFYTSLPATNAKRLRKGALATKQSSFLVVSQKAGLLRGACHRARVRATRWLAMTVSRPLRALAV
jgi:hypothetical protein